MGRDAAACDREGGQGSRGAGEQGAGELCEAARPGLTLPAQGCVRLREAARRQGLAAWPGRRHSTYTGGGRVGCMQGAREPATTSSPCRRDMCPYLGCWGATAGLGSSSPLLLRLQGLQRGGSRPYRLYGVVSPGLLMPCFTHTTHQHISTPLGGAEPAGGVGQWHTATSVYYTASSQ